MIHKLFTDRLLTCCRTPEELAALRADMEAGNTTSARQIQSNLTKEKTGYRCTVCGAFYPFLTIRHMGDLIDHKSLSRPIGSLQKYKKSSEVFRGDHYYASNKKTLLKFRIDADGNACQAEEIPMMGGVYHVDVSDDGRYVATETFGGTIAVIDAETKETIARKRSCKLNGDFRLSHGERLLYYKDDAVHCWDFMEDRETVLWQAPGDWIPQTDNGRVYHSHCAAVLRLDRERMLFQLIPGDSSGQYALILRGMTPEGLFRIEKSPVLSHLSYEPNLDQYTLPTRDKVIVYDRDFRPIDLITFPELRVYQDGGGIFPITKFEEQLLHHAYLSPEGNWVLLDYFNYILLMERHTGLLRYCVYSYTGRATRFMGFADEAHIWYNWGDSTYVMEITP